MMTRENQQNQSPRFKNRGFYTNNSRRASLRSENNNSSIRSISTTVTKCGKTNNKQSLESSIRSITNIICDINDCENDENGHNNVNNFNNGRDHSTRFTSSSTFIEVVDLDSSSLFNTSMCSSSFDMIDASESTLEMSSHSICVEHNLINKRRMAKQPKSPTSIMNEEDC